jgi:hypothetical protein
MVRTPETVAFSWTVTCPPPPPPAAPAKAEPPAPPPPTARTSTLVTPLGTVQLQVVTVVNDMTVNPAGGFGLVVGEQAENEGVPVVIEDSVPIPSEFTARIRIL